MGNVWEKWNGKIALQKKEKRSFIKKNIDNIIIFQMLEK